MSEQRPTAPPYKPLGQYLKGLRQQMKETLAEVCGAVEIDEELLRRIEGGHVRPSEDILLLLISHFDIQEKDAARVWRMAGYEQPHEYERDEDHDEDSRGSRSTVLVMAIDPRIVYSDGVQISANNNGVVMNFAQAAGTPNVLVTARIGMSRQQAYKVMETLQASLYKSEPRQLPPSRAAASTSDIEGANNDSQGQSKAPKTDA